MDDCLCTIFRWRITLVNEELGEALAELGTVGVNVGAHCTRVSCTGLQASVTKPVDEQSIGRETVKAGITWEEEQSRLGSHGCTACSWDAYMMWQVHTTQLAMPAMCSYVTHAAQADHHGCNCTNRRRVVMHILTQATTHLRCNSNAM